jgi:hypothetical protein
MYRKILNLFIIINLLSASAAICQQTPAAGGNAIVDEYNNWLQLTHFDKLFLAEKLVSGPNNLSQTLVLIPAKEYRSPDVFAKAWDKMHEKLTDDKKDLYAILFNKLAAYSTLPPSALSIKLTSNDAEVFSLNIYYTQEVQHKENILVERGDNDGTAPSLDMTYIEDRCFDTARQLSPLQLCALLHQHFMKYQHGSGYIQTDSIINARQTSIKYRIWNVLGSVTNTSLHEVIILNITTDAKGICYNTDILYAGGGSTPNPDKSIAFYHDVLFKYRPEYDTYTQRRLPQELKNIFHGK